MCTQRKRYRDKQETEDGLTTAGLMKQRKNDNEDGKQSWLSEYTQNTEPN